MTEGSIHIAQIDSDQELESAAVAGAAAVQRLIADRNDLRSQLTASRATQEEQRRRLGMLHQRYIELARNIISQLEHFDGTIRGALRERAEGTIGEAANIAGPARQFDGNGLPVDSQPSSPNHGLNGTTHVKGRLPLEP
jgi:hypothetical protein